MYSSTISPQRKELFNQIVSLLTPLNGGNHNYPDSKGEYWALCPFHPDEHIGSFSFNLNGFHCFSCGSYGNLFKLAQKLGLQIPNKISSIEFTGITLEQYSSAKKLPLDFLQSLQVTERKRSGIPHVSIPYFDRNGQVIGTRIRLSLIGNNRFIWQKNSHLIPYGLWKLKEPLHDCNGNDKHRDFILLVEGESDAQTLWYYDIPALGIPGATTWKNEWKEYVTGKKVFVWQEPGEAGKQFIQKIGKDIPEIHIIQPPQNRKDISDCHISGDIIPNLIEKLMQSSISFIDIQKFEKIEEESQLLHRAESVYLGNMLEEVVLCCKTNGIVGEEKNIKLLYLALTSRVLDRPISVAIKGPSSGGKSFLVETIIKFFPESSFYSISSMSEKALFYSEESFIHRFLIIYEAAGLSSDFISYVIRSLLSEGHIRHITVEKSEDGMHERVLEKEGPTGFITTTTLISLHPENETRLLSLTITDDSDQTKRIMMKIAENAMGESKLPGLSDSFLAYQLWLEKYGNKKVVIPFASILAELTRPAAVRIRRDFKVVINLIRIVAILYQKQREIDEFGQIIASLGDYRIVYDLVSEVINEGAESSVKPITRQTVAVVGKLLLLDLQDDSKKANKTLDETQKSVDIASIASELNLDTSSTSRRVKQAIAGGFLENLESRKGFHARIVLGRKIPEDRSILPTPEELQNKWLVLPESLAIVQHLSDDSEDYYEQSPIL